MSRPEKKLLWVFPTFAVGGAQRRFASLVGALDGSYEHLVCAMDGDYGAAALLPAGVHWRRADVKMRKTKSISLRNLWRIRRLIADEHPDLLLTTNWGAIEWLMANRGPGSVSHVHFEDGFGPDERPDAQNENRAWTRRRAFPGKNRAFVAPSRIIERVMSRDWNAAKEQIHYIPNGVDLDEFKPRVREATRGALTIGGLGALRPEKRYDRLIRLVKSLRDRGRDARGLLVGDGPEAAALRALASELGVESAIEFTGAQADVATYLARMDAFAVTSDTEQMPISLIEAMATGLPIIGTAVGDVSEMVAEPNRGFIHPVEDEGALAACAEVLAIAPEMRKSIGTANAERAQAYFSLDTMAQRYDNLFTQMIRTSKPLMLPAPGTTPVKA